MKGSDHQNIVIVRGADDISEYAGVGVYDGNAVFTGGGVGVTTTGIVFRTSNGGVETERVYITGEGKVGIGSTNPQEILHIHDGDIIIGQTSGNSTNNRNYIKFGRVSAPKAAIGFINNRKWSWRYHLHEQ